MAEKAAGLAPAATDDEARKIADAGERGSESSKAAFDPLQEIAWHSFAARCEAQSLLHFLGDVGLHDTVDELQLYAEDAGLAAIDQDAVQSAMARAFTPHTLHYVSEGDVDAPFDDQWCVHCEGCCSAPWFCAAVESHVAQRGPAEAHEPEARPLVAASTLEAFQFLVRQRDPDRLRAWLARHSDAVVEALMSTAKGAAA